MKKFIVLGIVPLCLAMAAMLVAFPREARGFLGDWFELAADLLGVFVAGVFVWLLFLVAHLGRRGSRALTNGDRTAGYRIGIRILLVVVAAVMSGLSIYVVVFDKPGQVNIAEAIMYLGGLLPLFCLSALAVLRSRQTWNGQRIEWRGLFRRGEALWSDLERVEHGSEFGHVTFHFGRKKKLTVAGDFHEAIDELTKLSQEQIKQLEQTHAIGFVPSTGRVTIGFLMWVTLTLLTLGVAGLMGYLFFQNTISVFGNMAFANVVWALLSAGCGLYFLYLAWLFQGPRYLWNDKELTHFGGTWRREASIPWSVLQAVVPDQLDTDTRVLSFAGGLDLRVSDRLKGAKDLIAYAESRLNA